MNRTFNKNQLQNQTYQTIEETKHEKWQYSGRRNGKKLSIAVLPLRQYMTKNGQSSVKSVIDAPSGCLHFEQKADANKYKKK